MTRNSDYSIDGLPVSEEAKEVLRKILYVASSDNLAMRESVKSLFVISPNGCGISEYARGYEKIIRENNVYSLVGRETYLELAFPKMATDKEYEEFFESPDIVAATTDSFRGVFLISFEQFSSYSELYNEEAFSDLLKYIDKNTKKNSFAFHVLPDFKEYDKLMSTLQAHINLIKVNLAKPTIEEAMNYMMNKLGEANISFTPGAVKKFEKFVLKEINISSELYSGYITLDRFLNNVVFEVACICDENMGRRRVDGKIIDKLLETLEFSLDEKKPYCKLGF